MFRRKNPVAKSKEVGVQHGVGFVNLPEWMEGALGMQVSELPSRLILPNVTPTVEIYKPRPRFIILPDVVGPTPNFTVTVPTGLEWRFQSLSFLITTSAAAANRQVFVRALLVGGTTGFGVSTGDYFVTSGNYTQIASQIVSYTVGPVGVAGNVLAAALPGTRDAIVMCPTPIDLTFFSSQSQIVVILQNGDAGDVISGIGLSVWERKSPESYER